MNWPTLVALSDSVRRWVVVVLLVVAAVALALAVLSWRAKGTAEDALAAANKRAELSAKGDIPVEPVDDLPRRLNEVMAKNAVLAGQVKKLEKDLKGAKAELFVHAEAHGMVGRGPIPNPAEHRGPGAKPESLAAAAPCRLFAGDDLRLKVDAALERNADGVAAIVGTTEAWATRPGGAPEFLLRVPFDPIATKAEEIAPLAPLIRADFALGARLWWKPQDPLLGVPSAIEVNGGLRLFSGWWADGAWRTDGSRAIGARREF